MDSHLKIPHEANNKQSWMSQFIISFASDVEQLVPFREEFCPWWMIEYQGFPIADDSAEAVLKSEN